jgi:site-specific DNA recombinase
LLKNEIYIGYRTYTQKRSPKKNTKPDGRQGDKKKINRSPDEIIRVKVIDEPLISEDVFREIQERVKNKSAEYHKKKSLPGKRFLYAGFLRCGECGQILYSTSGGRNHQKDYYYCRSKNYLYSRKNGPSKCKSCYIQKEHVENTVTSFVSEKLTQKNYLNSLIKQIFSNSKIKETEAQTLHQKRELKRIKRKKAKILDLYGDGLFTKEELDKKVNCLNDEVSIIKAKLTKLERSEEFKKNIVAGENIETIVTTLTEFPYWTPTQKRTYLRSQMSDFSVTKEGITSFTLNFCKLGNHMGTDSWPPPA